VPTEVPPDPQTDVGCFAICQEEASMSLDRETKIGCVVLSPEREIRTRGHNTLPLGIKPDPVERLRRPDKYTWTEHAERNAIYAAARFGIPLEGCTMYVDLMPCIDCARGIIQSGIREVVVSKDRMQAYSNLSYREQHVVAASMLKEAGVKLRTV
jgi:dCMP deaminase